ncbi:MAG: hypothetical protein AB7F78_05230 [Hyphomicrobiaceae bacterium]
MITTAIWMLGISSSVAIAVIAAATQSYYPHMAISALVSILIALAAFRELRQPQPGDVTGRPDMPLRHIGLICAWGSLTIVATYAFDILSWSGWWRAFLFLLAVAGASLSLSTAMRKAREEGQADQGLLRLTQSFAIVLILAMFAAVADMSLGGHVSNSGAASELSRGHQDWAARNVFFFGAFAIAFLSGAAFKETIRMLNPSQTVTQ